MWRHGKHVEAAEIFKSHPYPIDWNDWKFVVGKRFAEVFGNLPQEEGLEAFAILLRSQSNPWNLQELAGAMDQSGNHELASNMMLKVKVSNQDDQAYIFSRAYHYRKLAKGKDSAIHWLRSHLPPTLLVSTGVAGFKGGDFELLWDLIEQPATDEHPEFIWLLRAAGFLQSAHYDNSLRDVLVSHFSSQAPASTDDRRMFLLGRYLLNLEPAKTILDQANNAGTRCEVGYYFGLKAENERQFGDASDWYRVAVETAAAGDNEYNWALNRLYKWYEKTRSLSFLEKQHS